jgi:beta-lactam-binding protein with PASTA domain
MSFKSFLISKVFFKHLGIIIISLIAIIFLTIKGLDIYTANGEYIIIPNLSGMDADSLIAHSSDENLHFQIIDSLYSEEEMPGTVVIQNPTEGAKVKSGRKVYLAIVAKTPEMVPMPNLIDLSIRRAVDVIGYSHLTVDQIIFQNDLALNAVLDQKIDTASIAPDSLLPSGTAITLIAGNGYKKTDINVPFLIGLDAHKARQQILKSSFNMGTIDTLKENFEGDWRVVEQYPHVEAYHPAVLPLGNKVSITLRSANNFNFDSLISLYHLPDSLRPDSLLMNLNDF